MVGDGLPHGFKGSARLESERYRGTGVRVECLPALRLASRLAGLLSHCVIRVDLHRELLVREEDLDQQRIIAHFVAVRAKERLRICRGQLAQRAPLLITGLDEALRAGEPRFPDGFGGPEVEPGRQVHRAPGTGAEKRRDAKGSEGWA